MSGIFDLMNGASGAMGSGGDMIGQLVSKFGNMQNAMRQLQGLLGRHGMNNFEQIAIENVKNTHYTKEQIDKFRDIADKLGFDKNEADQALKKMGLI